MLDFVFEDGMGFERYVDYVLDVPMYFVYRNGEYIDASGQSFRDFMAGKLPAYPGQIPTMSDWADQMTLPFPEVRLKRYLEMRGADGGPWQRICALPAFWVGLLYDSGTLDEAWELVKDWTAEEREAMRRDVPRLALNTPFRGQKLQEVAKRVVELSAQGLRRRACLDSVGGDEGHFLEVVRQIADSGITPAEEKLEAFHGRWHGSVDPVFPEYAY